MSRERERERRADGATKLRACGPAPAQLTARQALAQLAADTEDRELITRIDGRLAIIFRPREPEQEQAILNVVIRVLSGTVVDVVQSDANLGLDA